MREYALMMNMIEYAGIYLKKKTVLNIPEFSMCLMQYITISICTNYSAVTKTKTYLEYC